MVLSTTEKAKIRAYIGFSAFMPQMYSRLESSMDLISTYPAEEDWIKAEIVKIDNIEAQLIQAGITAVAGKADDVEVQAIEQAKLLVNLGRMSINRIARKLSFMQVGYDYFGAYRIDSSSDFQVRY